MKSLTSTRWVMTSAGLPKSGWAEKSGSSMPSGSESRIASAPSISAVRLIVFWKTCSMPTSSAARAPTRCTWMWSGWP